MRAMILAAGRGERMRPLTDHLPKPLLTVGGQSLIAWHLRALADAGFTQVVINTAYLAETLEQTLGDGRTFGLRIRYSREPEGALETAGGIATAQPWSSVDDPFLLINGDVFCRWPLHHARAIAQGLQQSQLEERPVLGHILLVPNPSHHPQGDFALSPHGELARTAEESQGSGAAMMTYSGIGVFMPSLFSDILPGTRAALGPLLKSAIVARKLRGEAYTGPWTDVGTPERLALLDQQLKSTAP